MECPKLINGKIRMCGSEIFDGMVPNISELKKFCTSGEYNLCPFFIRSKKFMDQDKIRHSTSDWNVFHQELVGFQVKKETNARTKRKEKVAT